MIESILIHPPGLNFKLLAYFLLVKLQHIKNHAGEEA